MSTRQRWVLSVFPSADVQIKAQRTGEVGHWGDVVSSVFEEHYSPSVKVHHLLLFLTLFSQVVLSCPMVRILSIS